MMRLPGFRKKKHDSPPKGELPVGQEQIRDQDGFPDRGQVRDSGASISPGKDPPLNYAPLSDTLVLDETITLRLDEQDTQTLPEPQHASGLQEGPEIRVGGATRTGTREGQQDALAYKTMGWSCAAGNRVGAALCDGMGGLNAGEKASALAVRRILEEIDVPWEQFPLIYPDALSDINYEVAHLKDPDGFPLGTGTTAVSASVENGELYYASVGDSRIYLIRGGNIRCLTRDHTWGNELDDQAAAGLISQNEARQSKDRAALTSYLGSRHLNKIDNNRDPVRLLPGDVVLLCSDGLYRSLPEPQIAALVRRCGEDMQAAAQLLADTAVSRPGRHDNTTVLLIFYAGS